MAKEAATALTEEVLRCPGSVLIPVSPPCYSLLHSQAVQGLCHAQEGPHLSPNCLSLGLLLLHL